jgi:hypothetical protein
VVNVVGIGLVDFNEVDTWGNWDVHIGLNKVENVSLSSACMLLNEYDCHAILRGSDVRINCDDYYVKNGCVACDK